MANGFLNSLVCKEVMPHSNNEVLEFDCYKANVNDILRHLHNELGFYLDILDKRIEYHSSTGYFNGRGWVHWIYKMIP